VAVATFNEPTMNRRFVAWLDSATQWLATQTAVGAVVFTGPRNVFITGADLTEVRQLRDRQAVEEFLHLPHVLMQRIHGMEKLTVAAINGHCIGGGMELALVCDFRFAAGDLRGPDGGSMPYLGLPEVRLGLVPALGGAHRLIELVGLREARRMLYSGELASASQAYQIGLVDRLVDQVDLLAAAVLFCETMLSQSPTAMRAAKRLVVSQSAGGLERALRQAADEFAECCCCGDVSQRIAQFRYESVRNFRRAAGA
jgi:enoyl-CoA hydratase